MTIFKRLKSYFFCHFRAIAIRTVWLLHTYIKLISRGFQDVQVKNHVTDNKFVILSKFVTAFEGECRKIIELRNLCLQTRKFLRVVILHTFWIKLCRYLPTSLASLGNFVSGFAGRRAVLSAVR